jgi:hypothetical protein
MSDATNRWGHAALVWVLFASAIGVQIGLLRSWDEALSPGWVGATLVQVATLLKAQLSASPWVKE